MGVTDLNKLIALAEPVDHDDYSYVLVDMSNMIVTYLFRHFARIPTTKRIDFENYSVVMDKGGLQIMNIEDVMVSIRSDVMADIIKSVNDLTSIYLNLKKIIFVSDPNTVYMYRYIYNDKVHMSCVDTTLFEAWLKLNNHNIEDFDNISIDFSSKEAERAVRVKSQMTEYPIKILDKEGNVVQTINDYDELLDEPDDEELKHIYHVLFTCTYFLKRSRLMKLMSYIQDGIINYVETNTRTEYYCSKGEADIFIKAYHDKYLKDKGRVLIMSNDTDYFMLFAEVAHVDVAKLSPFNPKAITNPFNFWSETLQIFDDVRFMRMMIARISALYGNDYTCHTRKIVADPSTIEAVRCIFNINKYNDIHEMGLNARSSIYKLMTMIDGVYDREDIEVNKLYDHWKSNETEANFKTYTYSKAFKYLDAALIRDAFLCDKDEPRFFNGYYETLLIYMNFKRYSGFDDMRGKVLSADVQKRIKNDIKFTIDFENGCKEQEVN